MKKDSGDAFFREVALRIHSSLDIGEALKAAFNYMRDFIPMDMMGVYLTALADDGGVKVFSVAQYGKKLISEPANTREPIMWLNRSEVQEIERFEKSQKRPVTIDNFGKFPLPLLKIFANIERYSMVKMDLDPGNYRGCSLVVAKEGKNVFQQEHVDLLLLARQPFTIAMSNAVRYLELLQLKEGLADENQVMRMDLERSVGDQIVGADYGLRHVMEMVKTVARTSSPVLLLGETGTGKEVIAKSIHQNSPRRDGPFVKVQCGAIPESLLDSELFGHEKGAFTGAVAGKKGRFERANNGTIFLDEIGELSLEAQVKLLRVLQEKEFERVGGQQVQKIDVRVIAATHRNLQEMVRKQQFREDLWFRLNVFPLELPPLRQRKEDIPSLVQYFMVKKSRELNLNFNQALAPGTLERLMQYDWPGNVRELQNVVERGLIICNGAPMEIPASYFPAPVMGNNPSPDTPEKLDDVIRRHLEMALEKAHGKIEGSGGAAELLDVNPSTLRGKLRKYGIPFGHRL